MSRVSEFVQGVPVESGYYMFKHSENTKASPVMCKVLLGNSTSERKLARMMDGWVRGKNFPAPDPQADKSEFCLDDPFIANGWFQNTGFGLGGARLEKLRPMTTAPKDGTQIRLLVLFTDNPLKDTKGAHWTIGHNNQANDGEDEWKFAGWNWEQDCYTRGYGTPVAWLLWDDEPDEPTAVIEEVRTGGGA